MDKKDLAAIRDVPVLQGFFPYLENEIKGLAMELDNRAYTAINNGTMTPELALSMWIERNAYRKILQRYQARIKVGQALGAANSTTLDKE